MTMTPHQALEKYYGYESFRPLQQEAIESVLEGRDVFVLMPTGGGKSLCYAIPSLVMEGLTVVVSPLISLMKDQVDNLQQNGIKAAFINSSLTETEHQEVLNQAASGEISLLYVAPERLVQLSFRQWLKQLQINFFAIDEAHCISQWGHDFRPEYRQLSLLRQEFSETPIMALTATATTQVRNDIVEQLALDRPEVYVASFFRSNLHYSVEPKNQSRQTIVKFITDRPGQSGIVYCQSRNAVERLTSFLQAEGIKAAAYHAGLSEEERRLNQDLFKKDEALVMVATVAFGMGIDKSNIRFVLHESAPRSLEHYYQETGRAGRDGQPSECLLLFSAGDLQLYRQFAQDLPDSEKRSSLQKIDQVQRFSLSPTCRHHQLLEYFSEQRLEDKCTSCDNCLNPRSTFEVTVLSQQILSCIYHLDRLGQSFAPTYISQILTGSANERLLANRHDKLSVYGLVKDYGSSQLRQIIIELANQGLLKIDSHRYNVVSLTAASLPVLKGENKVWISEMYLPQKAKAKPTKNKPDGAVVEQFNEGDKELFERLRSLRKKLATEDNVPPYVVFADTSLNDMVNKKPTNLDEFAKIYGVGQHKLEKYGQIFLDEISS